MTIRSTQWTRRQFSQALGATAAASVFARQAAGLSFGERSGLAFVGTPDAIHVFRVNGSRWSFAGAVDAAAAVHLAMHPTLPVVYGVHGVSLWGDRPRGAVSAYRFDPLTGSIAHLGTQPLSLSATHPRHAVVTREGLFVSAEQGGIYNLLPIGVDGALQPVSAIRKELGTQDGEKVAAPGQIVLHPDGSLLAIDAGQETISRFEMNGGAIVLRGRTRVHRGDGPSQVAVSPNGKFAYALNAVTGAISTHSVEEVISQPVQMQVAAGAEAMAMHTSGSALIVTGKESLAVLQVDERTGRLSAQREVSQPGLQSVGFTQDGTRLVGVVPASGEVVSRSFDAASGRVGAAETVARVEGCVSLLLYRA